MDLVEGVAEIDDLDAFLAELDESATAHGCTVQAFDARYVVSADHLRRATELADRAVERRENVARERGVEILLYAAGRRQINRALEMGVSEGRVETVVLVDEPPAAIRASEEAESPPAVREDAAAESPDREASEGDSEPETAAAAAVGELLEPAETLGEYDPDRVRDFFGIERAELAATAGDLPELVLERVALLDVEK